MRFLATMTLMSRVCVFYAGVSYFVHVFLSYYKTDVTFFFLCLCILNMHETDVTLFFMHVFLSYYQTDLTLFLCTCFLSAM